MRGKVDANAVGDGVRKEVRRALRVHPMVADELGRARVGAVELGVEVGHEGGGRGVIVPVGAQHVEADDWHVVRDRRGD